MAAKTIQLPFGGIEVRETANMATIKFNGVCITFEGSVVIHGPRGEMFKLESRRPEHCVPSKPVGRVVLSDRDLNTSLSANHTYEDSSARAHTHVSPQKLLLTCPSQTQVTDQPARQALPKFSDIFGSTGMAPADGPLPSPAASQGGPPVKVTPVPNPYMSVVCAPAKKRTSDEFETDLRAPAPAPAPAPKPPAPKKARTSGSSAATAPGGPLDVSSVSLPHEETGDVPVYETCDMVRRKLRAFLKKPDIQQASFLREIAKTWENCAGGPRRLQAAQLNRFLAMAGPVAGNTSGVYYAAYVFFEKLRLRDGKPKSADRLEMERQHRGGVNTTEVRNHCWLLAGETAQHDKYGNLVITGGRR